MDGWGLSEISGFCFGDILFDSCAGDFLIISLFVPMTFPCSFNMFCTISSSEELLSISSDSSSSSSVSSSCSDSSSESEGSGVSS